MSKSWQFWKHSLDYRHCFPSLFKDLNLPSRTKTFLCFNHKQKRPLVMKAFQDHKVQMSNGSGLFPLTRRYFRKFIMSGFLTLLKSYFRMAFGFRGAYNNGERSRPTYDKLNKKVFRGAYFFLCEHFDWKQSFRKQWKRLREFLTKLLTTKRVCFGFKKVWQFRQKRR